MSWPWSQLGLPGPSDLSQVRHAYAEKLKTTHPEDDPEGFQRLHSAYQLASRMARQQGKRPRPEPRLEEERARPPESRFHQREDDLQKIERPEEKAEQEEQDFDFDELLQTDGPPPRSRQEDEEERDFDFDQLLQEDSPPPRLHEEEREQDFDFERLFAEGEAERAEARRRRAEERRRAQAQARAWARERQKAQEWTRKREQWQRQEEQKEQRNAYEQERRGRFDQEQFRWQNTETILHTVEMLYSSGAGAEAWRKFFQSPLFQQNKGSIDLIFGLEDFVSTRSGLSQGARLALYLAYGFDKGVSRPELRPLYQMLLPAWQAEQGTKRQKRVHLFWCALAGFALVPISMMVLTSEWLPALFIFLGLGWVAFVVQRAVRLGNQEKRVRGQKAGRRQELWSILIGIACVAAALAVTAWLRSPKELPSVLPTKDPREQVCQYLEQDYGEEFRSLYIEGAPRFDNVFSPENEHIKMFLAGPDGDRVVQEGRRGYITNYPDMMVLWALKDFASARMLQELDLMNRNQNLESWETCGVYLIVLPFYGAGDIITDLGKLLESLKQEDWYQLQPPSFKVVLCSKQFKEGRLILQEYESSGGDFDAQAVREDYEEAFAHAYCAQLLQDNELDRDFVHGGEELYTMASGGMAELKGEECCKLYGLDAGGEVAMEYYVSTTGTTIYCVPGDFWAKGGTEEDIQFYRLLHVEVTSGVMTLFYPWITGSAGLSIPDNLTRRGGL